MPRRCFQVLVGSPLCRFESCSGQGFESAIETASPSARSGTPFSLPPTPPFHFARACAGRDLHLLFCAKRPTKTAMSTWVRMILCAVALSFSAQAIGVSELIESVCVEKCDSDDIHGHCPPTCSCACSAPSTTRPSFTPIAFASPKLPPIVEDGSRGICNDDRFHPAAFVAEILHVPIASLA